MMCHKEDCKPLLDFCTSLNFITNRLVRIVLWYSPIGIMFLVMTQLSISDVSQHASLIGLLIATVLSGLAIHLLIILPGILFFFTGKNPITFYKNLLPAMATAFGKHFVSSTFKVRSRDLFSYLGLHFRDRLLCSDDTFNDEVYPESGGLF